MYRKERKYVIKKTKVKESKNFLYISLYVQNNVY